MLPVEKGMVKLALSDKPHLLILTAHAHTSEHVEDNRFRDIYFGSRWRVIFPNLGHPVLPMRPKVATGAIREPIAA
jgi:hypothetical protein